MLTAHYVDGERVLDTTQPASAIAQLPHACLARRTLTCARGGGVVYVRDCYAPLLGKIKHGVAATGRCAVKGTAGVGLTTFAHYVCKRFLDDDGLAVVYVHKAWDDMHLLLPAKPRANVQATLARFNVACRPGWAGRFQVANKQGLGGASERLYGALAAERQGVVVIVDATTGGGCGGGDDAAPRALGAVATAAGGALIVVGSGAPAAKPPSALVMPMWSRDELVFMMQQRLGNVLAPSAVAGLDIRIRQFGTLPGVVAHPRLSHGAMLDAAQACVDEAFNFLLSAKKRASEVLDPFSASTPPRWSAGLVHAHADGDFNLACVLFASEHIERKAFAALHLRLHSEALWPETKTALAKALKAITLGARAREATPTRKREATPRRTARAPIKKARAESEAAAE